MTDTKKDFLQPVDEQAIRLAKTLLRTARYAALAFFDPETGHPSVSRVAMATDIDGTPIILISALAAHTRGLLADPHCSLLVGEPEKGDPLAYPRMSLSCVARRISDETDLPRAQRRFLSQNPKAKLYSSFPDFAFFRLEPVRAQLNGGFGKAYIISPDQFIVAMQALDEFSELAEEAMQHLNRDHPDTLALFAQHYGKAASPLPWKITGIDPDGFNLCSGDHILHISFDAPVYMASDLRMKLENMADTARVGGPASL